MCFGGPAPVAPPPPPPPPQLPQTPTAAAIRADTAAQAAGSILNATLLTGGRGAPISADTLGKKTLLGQ